MKIFLSAGEASGDLYGAQLITALKHEFPINQGFYGLGGTAMQAVGFRTIVPAKDVAVVGLAEVVRHLPRIRERFNRLLAELDREKPDAAVLIDFPEFNLRLARELHKRKVPVYYFISPQLWAWRKGRIAQIRKYIRKMIVIFPFEEGFYREHGVEVEYVGHPLADMPLAKPYKTASGKPYIALLPGSRRQEVVRHIPEMLDAAQILGPEFDFVLPVASTLELDWIKHLTEKHMAKIAPKITLDLTKDARAVLAGARASIVASGTATVEAALEGNPFVVIYKVAGLTYTFGRHLVDVPHFAMANLIAEKRLVPELIQSQCTAERIVHELRLLLKESPERKTMMEGLQNVRARLAFADGHTTAIQRAAQSIRSSMQNR